MRIWDVSPGYLNRQSLLGEHRELHGMVSIMVNGKKGYSRHPETLRWVECGWALRMRHQLLAAEMNLRGYVDRSPVTLEDNPSQWPDTYIDPPLEQLRILQEKYVDKEPGRIPFPKNAQQMWSHHKYSVMARDNNLYKEIGPRVARMKSPEDFAEFALLVTETLRKAPSPGGLQNALQHMWGHVSDCADLPKGTVNEWSLHRLLMETRRYVAECKEPYLAVSTALSELQVWLPD